VRRHERFEHEPTEGALVDEPELGTRVGEVDVDPQMELVRLVGSLDEQLAAHPEMRDDRLVRWLAVRYGEDQPQVLAPALRGLDGPPGQPRLEILGPGQMTAH